MSMEGDAEGDEMNDTAVLNANKPREGRAAGRKVIDIHAHVIGTGDSGSGCILSREFRFGASFSSMLMGLRIPPFGATDARIRESVLSAIGGSSFVDRTVVLAMDGVYKNGAFSASDSHAVVTNDYVIAMAKENSRVLFGASVHPYREGKAMVKEVMRCIDAGAALFVWAPTSQKINPEDDRCIPFYIALAREGVPLLYHGGLDFGSRYAAGTPSGFENIRGLSRALDIGVKVIISFSHLSCGGATPPFNHESFDDLVALLRMAEQNAWDLFVDISSLCSPSRVGCLDRIRKEMESGRVRPGRLLYGSDFPRPVIDINRTTGRCLTAGELRQNIMGYGNMLDGVFRILKEYGVEDEVFTAASDVLKI